MFLTAVLILVKLFKLTEISLNNAKYVIHEANVPVHYTEIKDKHKLGFDKCTNIS